jgi:hypothetical protein
MLERHKKYFWDYTQNASDIFKLKRIIEYASFPDLISFPFDILKKYLPQIEIENLRTSEKRKAFIKLIRNKFENTENWEDSIRKITEK